MKKTFRWILGVLLTPVILFLILTVLLYLPPVQNWAVDKIAAMASEKTGMHITVDHVQLSFPLDLAIDGFKAEDDSGTIADVERLVVDVQLLPLFQKRVVINTLELSNTRFDTSAFVEAARVQGHLKLLSVSSRGIDLDKETVEVNGTRLEDAAFDVALNDSVPKDTTKSENRWKIHVDELSILRTDLALHMPGDSMRVAAHFGSLTAHEALIDLGAQAYTVNSIDWGNGSLNYDKPFLPPVEGIDFNHLGLSNINIGIDSIYFSPLPEGNPGGTLRLYLRQVAMKEKSGLQLTNLTGPIAMENGSVRLPSLRLSTPESDIELSLDMPLNLTQPIDPGKLRMHINAQIGKSDLMQFVPGMSPAFWQHWPYYPLTISGSVNGNLQHLDFNDLDVMLPTAFHATAKGFAANLDMPQRLLADVQFTASTQNLGFVMAMMPRDMQRDYRIPPLLADGRLKADGARYMADITAHEGSGSVKVNGNFNADAMRYDASLKVNNLNVHHFMPRDSIYTVTADITAHGQGTDFMSPRTTLEADVQVAKLHYGSWNLDNIAVQARVANGHALADINSHNDLLNGLVSVDALMNSKKVNATLTADVDKVDLYAMGLVEDPLSVALCGHVDVTTDTKLTHYVSGLISDIVIRDSVKAFRSEFVGLHVRTDADTTLLRAQSGDFIIKLDAKGDYERLFSKLASLGDSITAQLEQRIIDQSAIRRLLPTMKLHVESRNDNPIAALLKTGEGIDFKDLLFDMTSSVESGLNGNGHVHSLVVSNVRLDTINFRLTQRKERLSFGGQIRNNKKNPRFVFNALFDGVLQERGATFGVRYYDSDDKLGARIGAQAEMVDSGISMHLLPERPTLGYKEFHLNKDNFLFLGTDKRVKAKVDLIADDGMGVKIYSEDTDPTALQDITVSLNRFNLDEITSVIPYAPRMTGIMNGDYHIIQDAESRISIVSDMAVQNMTYERSPIGNVSTELVYLQKGDSAHAVEARLIKEDMEIGNLSGTYYNSNGGSLDARFRMVRLPLSLVNGFVPDQMLGLEGYGDGVLAIKGSLSHPQVNGQINLDSTYVVSVPYGVALRVNNDPVRITNSKLQLDNFTIFSQYNDSPLTLQGYVDFSDMEKIGVNMRLRAKNYQIIGAKENLKSVAYGKAFVDVFAMLSGTLDNLSMRGRLNVLGTTDMSYVLRDSPLTTDNQLDELVKFTDFKDTTQVVVERPSLTGFKMDMTIDVSNGTHIMAYLNTDHSNYIDLMGGGTLRMQYTPADNLLLTGRYTLSNGEMKYSLPVIPLKTFTIQNGSYIEFTGDMMNPTLNITATERTKATVASNGGTGHSVDFDCGVKITKTLSNIGVEFILDAPEDMQLHSELQAMGVEQRAKLAVSMLTTGMYLSDGNTSNFSMNSALSSFLNSEINSITGNALRTLDVSFGMDNSTDASGEMHTDYSFKFAKRFMNNRLKIAIGGKVSTGAELQQRNNSFFDNVSLEYRLDDTANKYVTLYYQNNAYDWLDGYSQKYGGGFIWRRKLQKFTDIFRFKEPKLTMPMRRDTTRVGGIRPNEK